MGEGRRMNSDCKNCKALEFIDNGIRMGNIVSFKLHEPRYNCALGEKIILINGKPHCNGDCKNKITRRSNV